MKQTEWILPAVIIALIAGFLLRGIRLDHPSHPQKTSDSKPQTSLWTCSMHPEIRRLEPGLCPKCTMPLVPLDSLNQGGGEHAVEISAAAAKLMEIESNEVLRKFATTDVRMVGKVDYDETRVETIAAWIPGRIDRLYVDYTGIPVKAGDHLAEFYSPELLTAQTELLQAIASRDELTESNSRFLRETADKTVTAAREKLRLWGFTTEQVAAIEARGTADDHMTIYAPASGIIIHKNAQEGMYVQTGTKIYTVADLSRVWVQLDAYESDLHALHYGNPVEFTTEAYPGETFNGTISFIAPIIDSATRTAKVRVIVDNADGRLKPGMFVRAVAHPRLAADGKVMNAEFAGKWICPMHPEEIKDNPGTCDECGMPLVTTESLGYTDNRPENAPLLVPASAVLKTGTRAVVYVEKPDSEKPTYEGREVVIGARVGDFYVVKSGLEEGEKVVTHGNFKIDAEMQIQAKPSMMSPPTDKPQPEQTITPPANEIPEVFSRQMETVVQAYFDIQGALAADDAAASIEAAKATQGKLTQVQMELLTGDAHMTWMKHLKSLNTALNKLETDDSIESLREDFYILSQQLEQTIETFPIPTLIYQAFCPMAFDNTGAIWLQDNQEISNPYFGQAMPGCGEIKKALGVGHDE
ncbi:MAG: efflux RND transporter periplasmic adaptor subunit [Pontiellaceae bacterium]|nr:efflux RND transporter periplasmic adaptor subunit [Pontiellaceae bacterium]